MATNYGQTFLNGFEVLATLTSAFTVASTLNRVVIANARVVNSGSNTEQLTIQMVPPGALPANRYQAIITKDIGPGQTVLLDEIISEPLQSTGQIFLQASTINTLSLTVGGAEITT